MINRHGRYSNGGSGTKPWERSHSRTLLYGRCWAGKSGWARSTSGGYGWNTSKSGVTYRAKLSLLEKAFS